MNISQINNANSSNHFDGTATRASILAEFGSMEAHDTVLDLICCAGMAAIDMSIDSHESGSDWYKMYVEITQAKDNTLIKPGVTNLEADPNSTVADIMSFTTPEEIKNLYMSQGSLYYEYEELLYKYDLLGKKLKSTTDEDEKQEIKAALNCILRRMAVFHYGSSFKLNLIS